MGPRSSSMYQQAGTLPSACNGVPTGQSYPPTWTSRRWTASSGIVVALAVCCAAVRRRFTPFTAVGPVRSADAFLDG